MIINDYMCKIGTKHVH